VVRRERRTDYLLAFLSLQLNITMPRMPKKKSAPRRRPVRRARKGGVARKSKTNVSDFASRTVIRTLTPAQTNQNYSFTSFALQDFDAAVGIAKQYQHYRMTGITLRMKPAYDTYSQATLLQKPNLYYIIDKAGAIPDNFTLEALKQSGARPFAFDEKPRAITWRPSVLTEDLNIAGAASATQYKVSPWLSTNGNATNPGAWVPSAVAHQGIKWYIEQAGGNSTVLLEVEIQFQFKKALYPLLSGTPSIGLTYATLDNSPDGVEGGSDGITSHVSPSML